MTYLIFDTETSGFITNRDSDDPKQGRLVQIACQLYTEYGKLLAEYSTLVKPRNEWVMQAEHIHGLRKEWVDMYGVYTAQALEPFIAMAKRADVIVGHNISFDLRVIKNEEVAIDRDILPEEFGIFCTMKWYKPILKLPAKRYGFKFPKLQEVYKHLYEEEFDNAHDAMADVRATARIFFDIAPEDRIRGVAS